MQIDQGWEPALARWISAGVVDADTAARIRSYERAQAGATRLRWPVWVALAFGALMVGAGVLLFVSAHWDSMSPAARFAMVLFLVAVFHVAGALTADRFAGIAIAFHALGSIALGAGIALAGQIFNLNEHWPGGVMLWALGAAIGWACLRDPAQFALVALLVPAWLSSEWIAAMDSVANDEAGIRILVAGLFLLALSYFTAVVGRVDSVSRRVLLYSGALGVPILSVLLAIVSWERSPGPMLPRGLSVTGWTVAVAAPLIVAAALRKAYAWPNAIAAIWTVALLNLRPMAAGELPLYFWFAAGAVGLVAWGVVDRRSERVNMGAAIFAATVIAFYFSEVMDKLERSVSLVGLGLLFLAGGWSLERVRRRLVQQTRGESA